MTGVLVTGATTPIGRALVTSLLRDREVGAVLAVAAEPEGEADLPATERLAYARVDLTRERDVRGLLFGPARDLGVTVVMHTALHRRAGETGRKVRALNVESTRALLRLAEGHPTIERFVFRSSADVYRMDADQPVLVTEDHPIRMHRHMPQYLRDRVEADVAVCLRMGLAPLGIAVLRCAEILAPDSGSQLYDYLQSMVCFRPLGFDPMLQLMSIYDVVYAMRLAIRSAAQGIFNIPGKDVLPLSEVVERSGHIGIAVPGPLLAPLYGLRSVVLGTDFRYDLNQMRFHFSGVLDGRRASRELGYEPRTPIDWQQLVRGGPLGQ